ncbi:extracellular serine-rich [Pyrenophora seminiperda CCB06]|uniref:Extracellular serine-rich n=1 Tax=Pyrenophora seminiperda CCB06 TaxID=1302712 RepID=A0A3M7LY06_9PLEO|nr:extracellular serine-rich [Pyrenophora seminiperda CCB06]
MTRLSTKWLATAIVVSQLFFPTTLAQGIASSILAGSSSVSPATITAAPSSSSLSTPSPSPKVHTITAGAGGFKFTPQEISNVSVGDIVTWEFFPPDHSVARAEFGSACVPYEDTGKDKVGFWSGTQLVNNTDELTYFNVTINSTEPIFFYCAAPDSCKGQHMVGVINPNSTQTLAAQVQAAAKADFQIAPGQPIPAEASSILSNPSTSTPTSTSAPHSGGSGGGSHTLSTGAIAGIAVGGAAFIILCAALFFFVGRSKTLKETIRRQDATNNTTQNPHMSQQHGSNYGDGGLASPGFRPGYATPPPGHHADYGFGSPPPPQYGQHSMNTQPVVAELNSPPMGQHGFSAELEAPISHDTTRK